MFASLPFNPKPPTLMHIDLNSCFASIEQQANPLLRGKPIAVAAYPTPSGCIIAPSIEAKNYGVRVGMRVSEGKSLCPNLVVLSPDPWKYRYIHLKMKKLLKSYTDQVTPRSIDEFVLDFGGSPILSRGIKKIAKEIKERIKKEIGEWLRVSVGIAPSRFLAKTASCLHKPDGLDEISRENFIAVYKNLGLIDLCGIKRQNMIRLNRFGIFNVIDFYRSPVFLLKAAFQSILGYYWYLRLRGWEIDQVEFAQKSFGNSFALPKSLSPFRNIYPLLQKLVEKAAFRMRKARLNARGIYVAILFRSNNFWHQRLTLKEPLFDSHGIYRWATVIVSRCPYREPLAQIAVSCFNLGKDKPEQLDLFGEEEEKRRLVNALDKINEHWGDFTITPARMLGKHEAIIDRIAFGGVKELEEAVIERSDWLGNNQQAL